jgi:3-hydroxyisobutyrate dehydrogenase-like beta-hydroxyacid dehydrogenase
MADRAARTGWQPRVFDPRLEAVSARVACGATAASSAIEAGRGADFVCVTVHDDSQALDVIDSELVEAMTPDGVVVLHSTVTVATVAETHNRCRRRGRHLVDVGVSGGPAGARDGTLVLIAGGEPELLERLRPLFDTYCSEVILCGPTGSGATAKAARNLIALGSMALAADALALAEQAGVGREGLARVVAATDPASRGARLLEGDLSTGIASASVAFTGLKDLQVIRAMAADLEVSVPAADAAVSGWDRVVELTARSEQGSV